MGFLPVRQSVLSTWPHLSGSRAAERFAIVVAWWKQWKQPVEVAELAAIPTEGYQSPPPANHVNAVLLSSVLKETKLLEVEIDWRRSSGHCLRLPSLYIVRLWIAKDEMGGAKYTLVPPHAYTMTTVDAPLQYRGSIFLEPRLLRGGADAPFPFHFGS